MIDELKTRLSGPVEYTLWWDLNRFAIDQGWIDEHTAHVVNSHSITRAVSHCRPDLLIPVALSMMPEGWDWQYTTFTQTALVTNASTACVKAAEYPAAALALAILEARTA